MLVSNACRSSLKSILAGSSKASRYGNGLNGPSSSSVIASLHVLPSSSLVAAQMICADVSLAMTTR